MERSPEKPIRWVGSALDDLRDLPAEAQDDLGYQLGRIQLGLEPDDWKPMNQVGGRMPRDPGPHRGRGVPHVLPRPLRARGLRAALFSEEDAEDREVRY